MHVRATARCYPTEDRSRIVKAIISIFPDAAIEGDEEIVVTIPSLDHFAELLQKQRIRSAARSVLRKGIASNSIVFRLNKQVATVGKISFSDENHPLGDISVEIMCDEPDRVIDEIAPLPVKEEVP